jgi:hypothetical protein
MWWAAIAQARAVVQRELLASRDERDRRLAALDEWSVLTVLSGVGWVPLVDRSMPLEPAPPRPSASGVLRRDVGEMVGRRREQRRWPVELLAPGSVGIVMHGIGGVGKTTLTDELCARIVERDPDRIIVTVIGQSSGEQLLDTIASTLTSQLASTTPRVEPDEAVRRGLRQAGDGELSWQERIAALQAYVFSAVPVLLVLDNFEDNLTNPAAGTPTVRDEDLAGVLARLSVSPGRCRLLVTSRYPFMLPDSADRVLAFRQLGPLSFAETLKLAWALPGLDGLDEVDLERVWRSVGGHPRCLEYVDALLGGAGQGRFPDVTVRLAAAVRRRLAQHHPGNAAIDDYFAAHVRLDAALAEVATLAADDVLLDALLDGLAVLPGAHRLLVGACVYRLPVDRNALVFQVGEPDPDPGTVDATGQDEPRPSPPLHTDPGTPGLVDACVDASLITYDAARSTTFVHRWTAAELARRWIATGRTAELIDAHRRAADYWRWRVGTWPQPDAADIDDLREVHYHYTAAVELDHAESLADLAWTADDLQRRLGDLGRRHEALIFSGEAVQLRRTFVRANPERHLPDLSASLNYHAIRLTDTGHDTIGGWSGSTQALSNRTLPAR